MKFTNHTNGPKTINTNTGPVLLAAGATSDDLDVSDAEIKAMEAVGFLGDEGMDHTKGAFPTSPEGKVLGTADTGGSPAPLGTVAGGDEVQQLVDGNTKAQLLDIAEGEGVEGVTADNNKEEIAAKIVEGRNATA